MFVVGDVLVSDDLLDLPFSCSLSLCKGACCVHGDEGAPVRRDEREAVQQALDVVRDRLRPAALQVIEEKGSWEEIREGEFATTCVDGKECVFVIYDGDIAKCSIQSAYFAGETNWPKPISCHLYPIRIERYGDTEVLNYESNDLCSSARETGEKQHIQLSDFLREPLTRAYGAEWYKSFQLALVERKQQLSSSIDTRDE